MCELCELCTSTVMTKLYFKSDLMIIVDCSTCRIPMLVFRNHGAANEDERRKARNVIDALFDYTALRTTPRKILDHEHWHIEGARYHGS